MQALQKPRRLQPGDTVAAVSLSWGGAGEPGLRFRYDIGKRRLEERFGLRVVEMPHTLAGDAFLYAHPELRARDLCDAFRDPSIKGIFSCIGGEESVRMLPHIDYEAIRRNPKVFLGYSDTTVAHHICRRAGLMSFYGPSILAEFADGPALHPYTEAAVRRALFCAEPLGEIAPAGEIVTEHPRWAPENPNRRGATAPTGGPRRIHGEGAAEGRLIGGCIEVLQMFQGTEIWPPPDDFRGAILLLETSEETPPPRQFEYWIRQCASLGILRAVAGIALGIPYEGKYEEEYCAALLKVVRGEEKLATPILTHLNFGHNSPIMATIPLGAMARIDCAAESLTVTESGVL